MKYFCLFFSLLALFTTLWVIPVHSNESPQLTRQQLAIRNIVAELLLLRSDSHSLPSNPEGGDPPGGGDGDEPGGGNGGGAGNEKVILIGTPGSPLFSLTKISHAGIELTADAQEWTCLKDNQAELIWEMKTQDSGLHDQDDTFTWYNSDPTKNGGTEGYVDNSGATCAGYVAGDPTTYCNTEAYVVRVNSDGLCGYYDWRLPTIDELRKIVALNHADPTLYATIFPKGNENAGWSSSPFPGYSGFAWHIYFNDGYAYGSDRSGNLPVLLVRDTRPSIASLMNKNR